jgi:hypothetical protein
MGSRFEVRILHAGQGTHRNHGGDDGADRPVHRSGILTWP